MSKHKKLQKNTPAYRTYALADRSKTDRRTNCALPDKSAVIAAKNWVDENEK